LAKRVDKRIDSAEHCAKIVDDETVRLTKLIDDTTMAAKTEEDAENRRRHCCLGLPLFVLNLSGQLLFMMIGTVYTGAVIRTIERRFGLSSSHSGILFGCNEMSNTVVVLFIGFFGRRAHKPRLIGATILFFVVSLLMMSLPHWLSGSSESLQKTTANNSSTGAHTFLYCMYAQLMIDYIYIYIYIYIRFSVYKPL